MEPVWKTMARIQSFGSPLGFESSDSTFNAGPDFTFVSGGDGAKHIRNSISRVDNEKQYVVAELLQGGETAPTDMLNEDLGAKAVYRNEIESESRIYEFDWRLMKFLR